MMVHIRIPRANDTEILCNDITETENSRNSEFTHITTIWSVYREFCKENVQITEICGNIQKTSHVKEICNHGDPDDRYQVPRRDW